MNTRSNTHDLRTNFVAAALAAGVLSLIYWYRRPIPPAFVNDDLQDEYRLLDLYLPEAEFAGEVSTKIYAPAGAIFAALQKVTLDDMPIATWLGTLRYLPSMFTGKKAPVETVAAKSFWQILLTEGGNIVLDEMPDNEVVIGAIGKFHNLLDQQVVHLANATDFINFNQPDYQKLAMSFRLIPLADDAGYHLTLTHRTHALSPQARWKFALYWIGIKPGGNLISWLLLRAIKSIAEKATSSVAIQDHHSS
jgi:hypothetical protein